MPKKLFKNRVYIIDDDESICTSFQWFFESIHIPSVCYTSANDFLLDFNVNFKGCILLDVRMPSISGFELFEELHKKNNGMPIIFMTGHCDIHMAEHCKKLGAFDFVEKPLDLEKLTGLIKKAFQYS